jgi:hypothetical protein
MERVIAFTGAALISAAALTAQIADRRADKWREAFDEIAADVGTDAMHTVSVNPFIGCGWRFGETIHATTTIAGERAEINFCLNRDGTGHFEIGTFTGGPVGE